MDITANCVNQASLRMNLGRLLERQATLHGSREFITQSESGETLSYNEFNRYANRVAHGFCDLGVGAGDYVAIMLCNSIDFLAASYALKKIGAVEVAINSTFRGVSLARTIKLTNCETLISSTVYLDALTDIAGALTKLRRIIMIDDRSETARRFPGCEVLCLGDMLSANHADLSPAFADDETAMILFTSGTTGVSKGCAIPHRSSVRAAESMIEAFDLTERDCVYSPYPMFHVGATQYDILPAMMVGGRAVIREKFSVSAFWSDIVKYGVTWFMTLGSVQQLLWAAPSCEEEKKHNLRFIWGTPLPVDHGAFETRFNVRLARGGGYGSTDAGSVALPLFDKAGAGKVLPRYEVAIVDDADDPVPPGEIGELVIRPREPATMASSYVGMPEETLKSWRNLWFHTGDLAWLDEDNDLHFFARKAERVRVKGEMVSAYEIEEVILTHVAIEDCAVVGVPDVSGEEAVKAFLTLRPGCVLSELELRDYCRPRMSRFMVPTQIEILREMPRTPSGKPAKSELSKSDPSMARRPLPPT